MTKGITGKEPVPREVYRDIIDHPHHVSDRHPQMSLYDRAAQFAPFAALSGYDEMVSEEARLADNKIELSDEDMHALSRKISIISAAIDQGAKPEVSITHFIPDPLKAGGRYETLTERIRRVDTAGEKLILDKKVGFSGSRLEIRIDDILSIHGDEVDGLETL